MTEDGYFVPQFLNFGYCNAPADASKIIDTITSGIEGTFGRIDDALIAFTSIQEHLDTLRRFFGKLKEHNILVAAEKCQFFQRSVEFMGMVVDADGVRPQDLTDRKSVV